MEVNGYSSNVTPLRSFPVGEVTLSQDEPLSIDLTMFPEAPTPIKVLFPKVTALMLFPVGEVALSQDEPLSVDLTMFPEAPTATNTPEPDEEEEELSEESSEVLSEESSEESSEDEVLEEVLEEELEELSSAHDEAINAILTIRTNQEVRLFILLLNIEIVEEAGLKSHKFKLFNPL